jgi:cell division protein FtsL
METFLVIVLLLIVFALWKANRILRNIQNTLFTIDGNLDKLNDKLSSSNTAYDDFE